VAVKVIAVPTVALVGDAVRVVEVLVVPVEEEVVPVVVPQPASHIIAATQKQAKRNFIIREQISKDEERGLVIMQTSIHCMLTATDHKPITGRQLLSIGGFICIDIQHKFRTHVTLWPGVPVSCF